MTRTGFVLANLTRRKARTALTLLSVTCAFLLFGLLQAVNVMLEADISFVGVTRLLTQARVSIAEPLPIRLMPQIEKVPGVQAVAPVLWFGGIAPDDSNFAVFATDPDRLRAVSPQWVLPEAQWRAFADGRATMLAGRLAAEKYGWRVGSRIPIRSNIFPNRDGRMDWSFDLVGIFDGRDDAAQRQTLRAYLNRAYVDEANRLGSGIAGFYILRLEDQERAASVAAAVDALFENSPDETKTMTEQDFIVGFVKQIGDVAAIVRWILFAVFFTLLLVVGNTMAQSVRERVPELAIMKTLGFTDGSLFGFVLAEAATLCAMGGLLGLGLATGFAFAVQQAASVPLKADHKVWGMGAAAIVLLSFAVGLLPALRARRLRIVDALAGR